MSYYKRRLERSLQDTEFKKEWEDNELEHQIALNIIKKRKQLGFTQSHLADSLHTTQSVISRIENADQNLTIGTLKNIAKVLQTDVHSLMFSEMDSESSSDQPLNV